ncbi:MAG: RluA family pseudouridine synthase [Nevskiaceae bacterium]|nr:MAG: RluA family pseudouridine synthase [Nevskiaceae bacterium]TBR73323.1 MAG: RluA family pseudouridine synthase [Nevskiaceae bacterium]
MSARNKQRGTRTVRQNPRAYSVPQPRTHGQPSGRTRPEVPALAAPPAQRVAGVTQERVDAGHAGQRVDNFLLRLLPGVPKSHVYSLLRSGQVRVDGGRVKPARRLAEGETVRVPPVRTAARDTAGIRAPDALVARLRAAVVHEDADYLALAKPAGLAVHGGSGVPFGVIEVLRGARHDEFLELAHRLDRDTSGVLLLAKSRPALLRAQRAFREGRATKRYFALLCGRLAESVDVDAALLKNRLAGGERFVAVDEQGKAAHSRFVPREHYRDATLCEVLIFSGRTHQIRVHALALGHPVAGDRKYGTREEQAPLREAGLKRLFLHSHYLELPADGVFPSLLVSAPLTDELREFLGALQPTGKRR